MADYYLGEIRLFGGNFAPEGWAICNGSTLPVSGNEALFSLLGTTWGGNGVTNFDLPDLRGRVAIGQGTGTSGANALTPRVIGTNDGESLVQITAATMPVHNHSFSISNQTATISLPAANAGLATLPTAPAGSTNVMFANSAAVPAPTTTQLDPAAVSTAPGAGQGHQNLMPYVALNYIIAITGGIYPTKPN